MHIGYEQFWWAHGSQWSKKYVYMESNCGELSDILEGFDWYGCSYLSPEIPNKNTTMGSRIYQNLIKEISRTV